VFGSIREASLSTWNDTILTTVLRGGVDVGVYVHRSTDLGGVVELIPTQLGAKSQISTVVLGDVLHVVYGVLAIGMLRLVKYHLVDKRAESEVDLWPGESAAFAVFRTTRLVIGYTFQNKQYARTSKDGVVWGSPVLTDGGSTGPLVELDITLRDTTKAVVSWAETDEVKLPVTTHSYSMDAADISGATLIDANNAQDGTISGATVVPGFTGDALSFDGVDDEVQLAGVTFNTAVGYSVSVYARVSSFPGSERPVMDSRTAVNARAFGLLVNTSGFVFQIENGLANSSGVIPLGGSVNTWHRFDCVFDAGRRLMLGYRDGLLMGTAPIVAGDTSSALFKLGTSPTIAAFYTGLLDRLRIWNAPLTAKQIKILG